MYSAASTVSEGLSSVALELGAEPIPCIADGDTGKEANIFTGFLNFEINNEPRDSCFYMFLNPYSPLYKCMGQNFK